MFTGVQLNLLEKGEPLIDKNWSYKNLWGLYAAKQKAKDQFVFANDVGFNIIYDKIIPKRNNLGKLTLDGVGACSDIWPLYDPVNHDDRIDFYKNEIYGRFNFICEINFPEPINSTNMHEYYEFFTTLISNPDFGWIENWQISNYPEERIINPITGNLNVKVRPEIYVDFLNQIRTFAKLLNPNIKIGGPGLFKGLASLSPLNYLNGDTSFDSNWLSTAISCGLLNNLDFFSIQLKQEIKGLDYDEISILTDILKEKINSNIGSNLPIYSIGQGRQVLINTLDNLNDQAYYNTCELLNTAKNGVIPIINSMVDICNNADLIPGYVSNPKEEGFGLCKYDMTKKPQYETIKFVLQSTKDFYSLSEPNKLYNEGQTDVDNITFISNTKEDIVSIVWSKNKKSQSVILLPNTDEWYTLIDGKKDKIISPLEFKFFNVQTNTFDFVAVSQHLNLSLLDYDDIKQKIFKKYIYQNNIMDNLLKTIPSSYNVNSEETNFYKMLKPFSYELSDVRVEVDRVTDNFYLETAQKESIYNNFGTLVNLEKQANWDYEKYRKLIQGVIKSLLTGPTTKSIEEAINLFINYDNIYSNNVKIADVKIHELYDSIENLDPATYGNILPQFAFIVEVNKNINVPIDQDILNRDLKYIVNILKPAHSLSFVVIILTGTEDYKKWYYDTHFGKDGLPLEFRNSDEMLSETSFGDFNSNKGVKEGTFGWKHQSYSGSLKTYNLDPTSSNNALNGGVLIGPRYVLYDKPYSELTIEAKDNVDFQINTEIEYANVLRFGYYDNENDRNDPDKLDPKRDNQIEKTNITTNLGNYLNPNYYNPDSGEYYKNWWLKYRKIQNDTDNLLIRNNSNLLENKSYKFYSESDTTKPNSNVEIFNENFDDRNFVVEKLPRFFKTAAGTIVDADYEKNNFKLINPPLDNIVKSGAEISVKYFSAPIGYSTPTDSMLPFEVKPWENFLKINSNGELELGHLPYNDINHRLYIDNAYPYLRDDSDLYFEDMDLSPNYLIEYTNYFYDTNGKLIKNIGGETYDSSLEDWQENLVDIEQVVDLPIIESIDNVNLDLETYYEFSLENYDVEVDILEEMKFGYYPCIITTNINTLTVSNLDQNRLGFGSSLSDVHLFEIEFMYNENYHATNSNLTEINIENLIEYFPKTIDSIEYNMDKVLSDDISIINNETLAINVDSENFENFKALNENITIDSNITSAEDFLPVIDTIEKMEYNLDRTLNDDVAIISEETIEFNLNNENSENFKKSNENVIYNNDINCGENYNYKSHEYQIEKSSEEKYLMLETIYSAFQLNLSAINKPDTTLLNNNIMSTTMEMYKMVGGIKIPIIEPTMIM